MQTMLPTFTPESLREIYAHLEWADARVWSVILQNGETGRDSGVREKLAHIHLVQWAYLKTWKHQPWEPPTARDIPDLGAIWHWAYPYYAEVKAFLGAATIDFVGEPLPDSFTQQIEDHLGPRAACPTVAESAFQVAHHSSHHRGQLNTRLRELGAAPPQVDYIAWVWFGRPAPEWRSPRGVVTPE